MALPTMPRKQAIDLVKAALLLIDGNTSGGYFFDLAAIGLRPALVSIDDITPDLVPWVVVIGGDGGTDYEAPVNNGMKQSTVDVVIHAVVKPDEARRRGYSAADLQELLVGDVEKALDLYARNLGCGSMTAIRIGTSLDPEGSFSFVEFVVSYRLRASLGV